MKKNETEKPAARKCAFEGNIQAIFAREGKRIYKVCVACPAFDVCWDKSMQKEAALTARRDKLRTLSGNVEYEKTEYGEFL